VCVLEADASRQFERHQQCGFFFFKDQVIVGADQEFHCAKDYSDQQLENQWTSRVQVLLPCEAMEKGTRGRPRRRGAGSFARKVGAGEGNLTEGLQRDLDEKNA
jgi:hypothetical protein